VEDGKKQESNKKVESSKRTEKGKTLNKDVNLSSSMSDKTGTKEKRRVAHKPKFSLGLYPAGVSGGEAAGFKFDFDDKKEKEEREKKVQEREKKKGDSKTKKAKEEKSSSPIEATGSSVFDDEEDDPLVLEIVAKQKKEARALAKMSKSKQGRRSESMAKMANFQMSQSMSSPSDATLFKKPRKKKPSQKSSDEFEEERKPKPKRSKKREVKEDKGQQKIGKFFEVETDAKVFASKDAEEDGPEEDLEASSEYMPDIDELLRLPERPEDGGKTKEEILDEMDAEIAARQNKHEEEMAKVDLEIEGERRKTEERRVRLRENALLRNRLESELTEKKLRALFKENLEHLRGVQAGTVPSARHLAFNKSVRARHALFYTMITDPFTDQQLDWTLEEISDVWMRNKREQMDHNEYVWKVLLPECFIKFYMDFFSVGKAEAEQRIGETPLRAKDRPRMGSDSSESDSD
jgi:hypothetical protein